MSFNILKQLASTSERFLPEAKTAKRYLANRHITEELIYEFEIGYCPTSNDFAMLGGRITFPIYDAYYRELIAVGGRAIHKDIYPKYWLTPGDWKNQSLYNLHRAKRRAFDLDFLIVVEGFLDVIRLFQYKIVNVVGLSGGKLSFTQACLIARYCNRIVFVLDGDEPGQRMQSEAHVNALRANLQLFDVYLPNKLDPDEYLLKYGAEAFVELVRKALEQKSQIDLLRNRAANLL